MTPPPPPLETRGGLQWDEEPTLCLSALFWSSLTTLHNNFTTFPQHQLSVSYSFTDAGCVHIFRDYVTQGRTSTVSGFRVVQSDCLWKKWHCIVDWNQISGLLVCVCVCGIFGWQFNSETMFAINKKTRILHTFVVRRIWAERNILYNSFNIHFGSGNYVFCHQSFVCPKFVA